MEELFKMFATVKEYGCSEVEACNAFDLYEEDFAGESEYQTSNAEVCY